MEKKPDSERRKKKEELARFPRRRMLATPEADVKLAAIAVSLNVRLRSAEMPATMQERVFRYSKSLLESAAINARPNPSRIAFRLKKELDDSYGPAWQCVVGKSFGSYLTHSPGGFLYFSLGDLSFLLFKTKVTPLLYSLP